MIYDAANTLSVTLYFDAIRLELDIYYWHSLPFCTICLGNLDKCLNRLFGSLWGS